MPEPAANDIFQTILATTRHWSAVQESGDKAALAALYLENAEMLSVHGDTLKGPEAIATFYEGLRGRGTLKLTPLEAEQYGDMAFDIGEWAFLDPSGQIVDKGSYMTIFKRQGGQWLHHRGIANSALPPKPAG